MARIRQTKNIENRLDSKRKFRNKIQLFKVLRVVEFLIIVAIAARVYTK